LMIRVITRAFNLPEETVRKEYKKLGDLGEVAQKFKIGNLKLEIGKKQNLSVEDVYQRLSVLADEEGGGSVERKISSMVSLLDDLDSQSVKYVVRIPLGRLRLGFSELTIFDALSWLIAGDKSKRSAIEQAYNLQADVGQIAQLVKSRGIQGLKGIKIQLGIPVMPALCQRLPNAGEIIKKMGKVAVESKYDGTRLQIHWSKKKVSFFTRNLENVTQMFPDLAEALDKEIKAKEVIFDGEAIGFDPKTNRFLPFQETIKRKRKYEIGSKAKEIPLKYFAFDILFKDGRDLINLTFNQRREILEKTILKNAQTVKVSPQIVTENPQELKEFHKIQIQKGLEGVVAKKWEAAYDPGRRGYIWVKLKQEKGKKGGGLSDTLDCVVMGYYKGKGKRTNFGIGAFLVGVRQSVTAEQILTISKIGTGLTDEQWREMRKRIDKVATKGKPKSYLVDKNLAPDVWCAPKIVVEIEADNITKSPIHTAQYALRFPRLVRFRDDKSPEEATTLSEAKKLYKLQK
ncbi:ATP-dependent DNA ligase, partial [Patescibacteria group bacterium]|nr:ATP-dependent DNA ligase [Patescibacteria group bacterium]